MKILIKYNGQIKCYEGQTNSELMTIFIKQQFGLEPAEYSIYEHPPNENKTFDSLAEFSEQTSKLIELKIKPGETSDGLPLSLKKILCKQIKDLKTYMDNNCERIFKLASQRQELLKYPFFNQFNSINSDLRVKGGMHFLHSLQQTRQQSRRPQFQTQIVVSHLYNLCDLRRQDSSSFLEDYFIVPDDIDACQDYILNNLSWKLAPEHLVLDKLLLQAEQQHQKEE